MRRLSGMLSLIFRRAAVLVLIVATLVSAVGCNTSAKEEEQLRRRTEALEVERGRLERELADLEGIISNLATSGATLTTVITNLHSSVYSVIYRIYTAMNLEVEQHFARELGTSMPNEKWEWETPPDPDREALKHLYTATVCLSKEELPDERDKITLEQLNVLLEAGWKTAIYVSSDEEWRLDAYLTEMEAEQDRLGIARTDTVCFEQDMYKKSHDEVLKKHGITCAIDTVAEGDTTISRDLTSEIWRVKADGWSGRSNSAMEAYTDLLNSHGCCVFLITPLEGSHRYGPADFRYDVDQAGLERMLGYFFEDVVAEDMYVDNAAGARARYVDYLEDHAKLKDLYEPQLAPLKLRLSEVERELHVIYYGY